MPRISKSERLELWLDRLQRQSQSGQTIAQFCAVEGVSRQATCSGSVRLVRDRAPDEATSLTASDFGGAYLRPAVLNYSKPQLKTILALAINPEGIEKK